MNRRQSILLALAVLLFLMSRYAAADKVVVIPLDSSNQGTFINVENSYTWSCPPAPNSLPIRSECQSGCIAVGGGCSAKTVGDSTDVLVTGGNYIKTNGPTSLYNAYECWMMVPSCFVNDSSDPPKGYSQVVCYCE